MKLPNVSSDGSREGSDNIRKQFGGLARAACVVVAGHPSGSGGKQKQFFFCSSFVCVFSLNGGKDSRAERFLKVLKLNSFPLGALVEKEEKINVPKIDSLCKGSLLCYYLVVASTLWNIYLLYSGSCVVLDDAIIIIDDLAIFFLFSLSAIWPVIIANMAIRYLIELSAAVS